MDKRAVTAAVLLVLIGGLVLGLVVGVVTASDSGGDAEVPNTITVQGTATASSAPDIAVLRVGFRAEGETAEEAFAEGGRRADEITAAIEAAGVEAKDIQTQDLRLDKRTENRGEPDERTYYMTEQDFQVTVRDVNDAGAVAGSAVAAGANTVGGIEFQLSDKEVSRGQALTEAVVGARSKAEVMAKAAGAEVGDVILIDETNVTYESARQPLAYNARMASDTVALEEFAVAPGEVETRVTITVIYELDS